MKVSVVIPAHNEGAYIAACLDSLLKQTEPADEIIVVNNNSTDDTIKFVKKYPVRIINEKKQGISYTRNKGFNAAKYEILARTDADTILPPSWIKKIKKSFADKELIALSGPPYFYDPFDSMKNSYWPIQFVTKNYIRIVKKALKHDPLYGPNIAIRKSAWDKIKDSVCLDDSVVHEDIDLAIHLAPLGKIRFDPTLVVNTSFRNLKKLESYFKYPYKMVTSIQSHKKSVMRQRSKQFVRKIVSKALRSDRAQLREIERD